MPPQPTRNHAATGRLEWVDGPGAFAALRHDWDDLVDADDSPFSSHAWFKAWADAFAPGEEQALLLRRGERVDAAVPLLPMKGGLSGMENSHTPFFRPIARDRASLDELLSGLYESGKGTILLRNLPAEGELPAAMKIAAARSGRLLATREGPTSPIVDTGGDFSAWHEATRPRWGKALERLRRKMGREFDSSFDLLEAPSEPGDTFERGLRLEASGWKGEAGTAIISQPPTNAFYRSIAAHFASRGELNLSSITLDGRMVAFDLSLLHGGRLYLLKTAYDESVGKLSPGAVLRLSVIERCFETGVAAHELLGGADPYKLKFSTSSRPLCDISAYRRRPGPMVLLGYERHVRPRLRDGYRTARARLNRARSRSSG